MKFNGNLAWNEAMRAIRANREVLLVMAGVFFFLPGVIAALFLSGIRTDMAARLQAAMTPPRNPAAVQALMQVWWHVMPALLLLMLVQVLGYMAMMALLTDARRPTVGEAMMMALRSLPTLIGTALIVFGCYLLASIPFALVIFALIFALGPQIGAFVGVTVAMLAMLVIVVRLSQTLPAIVIEGRHRPLAALQRSWAITRGNTLALLAFFLLLVIAYVVISLSLGAVLNMAAAAAGNGPTYRLIADVLAGAIGALSSIVITAILAATHRQLA